MVLRSVPPAGVYSHRIRAVAMLGNHGEKVDDVKLLRRKPKERLTVMEEVIVEILSNFIKDLRCNPIKVDHRHEINRKIPIPRQVTLIAENKDGGRYQQSLDLSFKHTMYATFPLSFFTKRDEDLKEPPIRIMMSLEYDPRELS